MSHRFAVRQTRRVVIRRSGLRPGEAERALPGDGLLPAAGLAIDRATTLPAQPAAVWPWLVQIGKDRAGWYLPRSVERFIPPGNRADRDLTWAYQAIAVGDEVADWGPGDPTLTVVLVEPPITLGFRTVRGKAVATWVLHLDPVDETTSRMHARLRIDRPRDWLTPAITYAGGLFDWLTVIGLFAGLQERLATPVM
jgi:hypothetical protein